MAYQPLLEPARAAAPSAQAGPAASGPLPGARTVSPLGAAAGLGLLLLAVLVGSVIGGDHGTTAVPAAPIVLGTAATTPATTPAAFVSDWTGDDGWTVQLQVLAKAESTAEQVAQAKAAATTTGAPSVGALDSAEFPTLTADSYIVYSGVYASKREAKRALKEIKADFPDAAVVEVSTSAPDAASKPSSTSGAADPALKDLENSSPEDYVKKSKKLPDTVGTEGDVPPVDGQAPGGGSADDATTIG